MNTFEVLQSHWLTTGYDGIPGDGDQAWIRCGCGHSENVPTPDDDISVAYDAWDRHLADAIDQERAA